MTEGPAKQDIEELVRRLESAPYPIADIREAGQMLAGAQAHAQEGYEREQWNRHAGVGQLKNAARNCITRLWPARLAPVT